MRNYVLNNFCSRHTFITTFAERNNDIMICNCTKAYSLQKFLNSLKKKRLSISDLIGALNYEIQKQNSYVVFMRIGRWTDKHTWQLAQMKKEGNKNFLCIYLYNYVTQYFNNVLVSFINNTRKNEYVSLSSRSYSDNAITTYIHMYIFIP